MQAQVSRGEVWLADLDPARGHEQAGTRPVAVISADRFNVSPARLVIVAPLTTASRGVPWHVRVLPPEGGLRQPSFVKCEDVRSITTARLITRWGTLTQTSMTEIADRLRVLLEL